tara:strand:+ start:47 stop:397 length:351 start_codon:yes stop_codon:yes gene_type:complete
MKYILTLILILIAYVGFAQNPPVEILQINSRWNQHNNVHLDKMPKNHRGYIIKVKYALLEEQGPTFKKSFAGKALPIIVLRVGGQTKYQWTADLSFRLKVGVHDILGTLDKVVKLK